MSIKICPYVCGPILTVLRGTDYAFRKEQKACALPGLSYA